MDSERESINEKNSQNVKHKADRPIDRRLNSSFMRLFKTRQTFLAGQHVCKNCCCCLCQSPLSPSPPFTPFSSLLAAISRRFFPLKFCFHRGHGPGSGFRRVFSMEKVAQSCLAGSLKRNAWRHFSLFLAFFPTLKW